MARYKKREDGRYQANIKVGVSPKTGKVKYKTVYARSIPDLDNKKAEVKDLVNKGIYADDKKMTVGAWADKWFKVAKAMDNVRTKEMYHDIVYGYIIPDIGDIRLRDLKKSDVQLMINGHKEHYRTCELIRMTTRQLLEDAIEDGLIYKNVARKIKLPPKPNNKKRALNHIEKKAIPKADFTDKEKAFVYILLYCGTRRGETIALSKSDIDQDRHEINIQNVVTFDRNNPIFEDYPKSDAGIRTLPIPVELQDVLYPYIDSLEGLFLFEMERKSGLMTKSSYRRFWEKIQSKINLAAGGNDKIKVVPGLTAHVFRHNYCTMLYYAGVDVKDAQRLMGHADIKMTLDIYTHLDELQSKTSEKLMNISAF